MRRSLSRWAIVVGISVDDGKADCGVVFVALVPPRNLMLALPTYSTHTKLAKEPGAGGRGLALLDRYLDRAAVII